LCLFAAISHVGIYELSVSWVALATVPLLRLVWRIEFASCGCLRSRTGFEGMREISDHQRSWGYEDGPWKGPGPPLLVAADF